MATTTTTATTTVEKRYSMRELDKRGLANVQRDIKEGNGMNEDDKFINNTTINTHLDQPFGQLSIKPFRQIGLFFSCIGGSLDFAVFVFEVITNRRE